MKYRLLGNSGLRVSELALGAMTFGTEDWGVDRAESRRVYDGFREAGGNFIDNALAVVNDPAVNFWLALWNSIYSSALIALSVVFFSTLAGWAFAKLKFHGGPALLAFVVATMAVPQQLGVVPRLTVVTCFPSRSIVGGKVGLVLASTAVALLVAEVALRLFGYEGQQERLAVEFDDTYGDVEAESWIYGPPLVPGGRFAPHSPGD